MNDLVTLTNNLVRGFAKALGTEPNAEIVAYVKDGQGSLPGDGACLLAWDANSIHSFVFDTTNATGIRGASDALKRLDDRLLTGTGLELDRNQILFAGGGRGLAVVARADVDHISQRLHALFAKETRIATCSVESAPIVAGDYSFGDQVRALDQAIAQSRLLTGPDAEPMVPFFAARCGVCGRRAAAVKIPRGTSREERLECEPCYRRIQEGKKNVRFQNEPTDYESIADNVKGGFFAVVYFDGNGIGRMILNLQSPLDYAAFSRTISDLVRDAFNSLAVGYGLREEGGDAPSAKGSAYQRPICGGDDLVAILPGDIAVPFARDLLALFQHRADGNPVLQHLGVGKLGASAGVAIGHAKFPIRHLLAESEALLKSAKKRVYTKGADGRKARNGLDFGIVTDGSPRIESVEPPRWAARADDFILSGRPYSLDEFARLSSRFRVVRDAARGIGRTQLFSVADYAQAGAAQLRNHVLYQVGRREGWRDLICKLGSSRETGLDLEIALDKEKCMDQIAPRYGGLRVFDLADMLDLYDHWREPDQEVSP